METANTVISDALQTILVQTSEQAIQATDFQIGRRFLNRMMTTSPYNLLGFTTITNPNEPVTIPDAALEGVIFNLAVKLLAPYDMPLTAELNTNAKDGLKEIRRIAIVVLPTAHPCTLPIGSGNEAENTFNNNHFYACPDDEVLAEQGGSILLESDT